MVGMAVVQRPMLTSIRSEARKLGMILPGGFPDWQLVGGEAVPKEDLEALLEKGFFCRKGDGVRWEFDQEKLAAEQARGFEVRTAATQKAMESIKPTEMSSEQYLDTITRIYGIVNEGYYKAIDDFRDAQVGRSIAADWLKKVDPKTLAELRIPKQFLVKSTDLSPDTVRRFKRIRAALMEALDKAKSDGAPSYAIDLLNYSIPPPLDQTDIVITVWPSVYRLNVFVMTYSPDGKKSPGDLYSTDFESKAQAKKVFDWIEDREFDKTFLGLRNRNGREWGFPLAGLRDQPIRPDRALPVILSQADAAESTLTVHGKKVRFVLSDEVLEAMFWPEVTGSSSLAQMLDKRLAEGQIRLVEGKDTVYVVPGQVFGTEASPPDLESLTRVSDTKGSYISYDDLGVAYRRSEGIWRLGTLAKEVIGMTLAVGRTLESYGSLMTIDSWGSMTDRERAEARKGPIMFDVSGRDAAWGQLNFLLHTPQVKLEEEATERSFAIIEPRYRAKAQLTHSQSTEYQMTGPDGFDLGFQTLEMCAHIVGASMWDRPPAPDKWRIKQGTVTQAHMEFGKAGVGRIEDDWDIGFEAHGKPMGFEGLSKGDQAVFLAAYDKARADEEARQQFKNRVIPPVR